MTLQFVDLTDDTPIPVPIEPASGENASDAYRLHLNLWLPSDDEHIVKARLQVQEGGMIKLVLNHKDGKSDPRTNLFPVVSPSEGVRVEMQGRKGLIWKVDKEHVAVVFDDLTCEIFVRSSFSAQADESASATAISGERSLPGSCWQPHEAVRLSLRGGQEQPVKYVVNLPPVHAGTRRRSLLSSTRLFQARSRRLRRCAAQGLIPLHRIRGRP